MALNKIWQYVDKTDSMVAEKQVTSCVKKCKSRHDSFKCFFVFASGRDQFGSISP